MTLRNRTFRIDDSLIEALRVIEERDGVPVSEQVRRAIKAWIAAKGVKVPAKPPAKKRS